MSAYLISPNTIHRVSFHTFLHRLLCRRQADEQTSCFMKRNGAGDIGQKVCGKKPIQARNWNRWLGQRTQHWTDQSNLAVLRLCNPITLSRVSDDCRTAGNKGRTRRQGSWSGVLRVNVHGDVGLISDSAELQTIFFCMIALFWLPVWYFSSGCRYDSFFWLPVW